MGEGTGSETNCISLLLEWDIWVTGENYNFLGTNTNRMLTTSMQKGVMISHHNVISNVVQIKTFEQPMRDARPPEKKTEVALALLPLSHIYGLVVIAQASSYRGDACIILPKFELQSYLNAIQTHKIQTLYLVCYLLLSMKCFAKHNLGSSDYYPDG
jgi:acyl-CoA synthetase (AMP-forming)/AMP-acid ligase II